MGLPMITWRDSSCFLDGDFSGSFSKPILMINK